VLPGTDAEGRPTCRTCSGIRLSVDCARCGIEDILYRAATCWRCALDDEITGVLTGLDGYIPAALVPLAVAVRTMPRPNSGITWLTNPRVGTVLSDLATGKTELTHEGLDALPASRTVEYIRGLLVEQKTLPARNEQVTAYSRWLPAKLATIDDPERRRLIETFAQWHQLRLLRSVAPAGPRTGASFLRAKQTTTLAIELLEWLARRGRTLGECSQEDVDAWFATGPSTRCHSVRFLGWAIKSRRVTGIKVPPRPPPIRPTLGGQERIQAIRRLLLDGTVQLPWRIAGGLVLLFGQTAQHIVELRTDEVDVGDGQVRLRLADDWLFVPEPFAALLRDYLERRSNMATAANPSSPWLFPGAMPGRPITAELLVIKLKATGVPVRASRNGTWQQLVREGPPSVLAKALGISATTAMKHAERAGAGWQRYAALHIELGA